MQGARRGGRAAAAAGCWGCWGQGIVPAGKRAEHRVWELHARQFAAPAFAPASLQRAQVSLAREPGQALAATCLLRSPQQILLPQRLLFCGLTLQPGQKREIWEAPVLLHDRHASPAQPSRPPGMDAALRDMANIVGILTEESAGPVTPVEISTRKFNFSKLGFFSPSLIFLLFSPTCLKT